MHQLVSEFVGMCLLIWIGNTVNANMLLPGTKGQGGGWVCITVGWGLAVFVAVAVAGPYSGAHINPAVSIGLAAAGAFSWASVPGYILAQLLGAMTGAVLVILTFLPHYKLCDRSGADAEAVRATFCTSPAVRSYPSNVFAEGAGTFVLVFAVLFMSGNAAVLEAVGGDPNSHTPIGLGALGALPVGLLVLVIGIGLGGPTGYAINPARDFGPRLVHALLPVPGKPKAAGANDWSYAWVPVLGPVLGGLAAAGVYLLLNMTASA